MFISRYRYLLFLKLAKDKATKLSVIQDLQKVCKVPSQECCLYGRHWVLEYIEYVHVPPSLSLPLSLSHPPPRC